MPLGKSQICQLAYLARLHFDSQQTSKISVELESVVTWFKGLGDVELTSEPASTSTPTDEAILRDDTVLPSLTPAEALLNAPDRQAQLFRVPGVLKR